jgi:hypothetical protein
MHGERKGARAHSHTHEDTHRERKGTRAHVRPRVCVREAKRMPNPSSNNPAYAQNTPERGKIGGPYPSTAPHTDIASMHQTEYKRQLGG